MRFFWKRIEFVTPASRRNDVYRYCINRECYIASSYISNNKLIYWEENFNLSALIIPLDEQSRIINAKPHEYRWTQDNAKNIINMYLSGIFL